MALDIGPILRSAARHRGAFAVVVLQLGAGVCVLGSLLLVVGWNRDHAAMSPGFSEADLLEVRVRPPVPVPGQGKGTTDRGPRPALERDLKALAGVTDVTFVFPPIRTGRHLPTLVFVGSGEKRREKRGWSIYTTPAASRVLGLRFVEGSPAMLETLSPDGAGVLLTRSLRDQLFAGRPALGQLVGADDAAPSRVVGVVEDVVLNEPFRPDVRSLVFRFGRPPDDREGSFLVRTEPGRVLEVAEAARAQLEARWPAASAFVQVVALGATRPRYLRLTDGLVTIALMVALVIGMMAAVGALALSSYLVAERTRQIGIRRALGATKGDIIRYFLTESALFAGFGTGLGLLGTLVLSSMLFAVLPGFRFDWLVLLPMALGLWMASTLAAILPARRAMRVPPSVASRGR